MGTFDFFTKIYWMPVVSLITEDGEKAHGPMVRQARTYKQVLAWRSEKKARAAAEAFIAKAGGKFEIKKISKAELRAEAAKLDHQGSPVKPGIVLW